MQISTKRFRAAVSIRALALAVFLLVAARVNAQDIQMEPAEYNAYDTALNLTAPQAQAAALESYLSAYPNSKVKADVRLRLMLDYSGFDHAKAVTAADALLSLTPNDLRAFFVEVSFRLEAAEAQADDSAKLRGLGEAAQYARRGLAAAKGPLQDGVSAEDYARIKAIAVPVFYDAIGREALAHKDGTAAVAAFRGELATFKPEQAATPAVLQVVYYLGEAYYLSDPPDYLRCAFYATRTARLAPDQFKPQFRPLASFCYKKYHGSDEGYQSFEATTEANVDPPPGMKITAAATGAEIVADLVRATPDLSVLALSDKEFSLQYGRPEDANRVWQTVQGKTVKMPGVLVIESTATTIKAALSDDAIQAKTADFLFTLKSPIDPRAIPPGSRITINGTYDSYTAEPLTIKMAAATILDAPRPPAAVSRSAEVATSRPAPPPASRGVAVVPPAPTQSAVKIPHNYALLFATSQYDHWPALNNPIPDADTFGTTLQSLYGFQVEEVKNATNAQILQKLSEYLHRHFEPQDQLLIFFSGHGYFDDALSQGFIVPANAAKPDQDSGHLTLVAHDTIMRYVNSIPSQHVVLILDACFSGTLDRKIAEGGSRGDPGDFYVRASLPELLQRKQLKRTREYFASGGKDFVPDGLPGHHSPFMSALLVTLNAAADNKGYATLSDLQQGLETVKPEPRWGDIQGDNEPGADFLLLTQGAINKLTSPK